MAVKLVELARLENPVIAETLRIALEGAGIAAFIESSETNRAMHYVGTALGGVRVMVPSDRKVEAERLLRDFADDSTRKNVPAWICPKCGETVDSGFETCWFCDTERPENAALAPPTRIAEDELEQEPVETLSVREDESNPYSPPLTSKLISIDSGISVVEAEAMVLRAWRASIIGLFLCPVVLHIYSMVVLIDTRDAIPHLSDGGRRRRVWATTINLVMIAIGVLLVLINGMGLWRGIRF